MWVIIFKDCIITDGQRKKISLHPNVALHVSSMVEDNIVILFSLAFATTYRLLLWVT